MAIDSARAKSLFLTASDLADPAKRAAFLDQECGPDAELRARVEALLKANDESPMLQPDSAIPTLGGAPSGPIGPESILTAEYRTRLESGIVVSNRYILEQKIGEGGMGEVWVAKQTEPVKRRVALKLIKPGMDSRTVLARFEQERQALALMDHPNIAKVLDAGLTPMGQPFFVMELVNGLALNKFCDELKLTPRERLELFVPICQAVQHAHQKGIVHRDLKPANILITMIDGKPVPKVIDFGVAKATAGKLSDDSIATQFGSVVGTLEYMSPEQAGFSGEDIDTRSDIYSLGVILYEMLTGLKPIDATRVKKAALTEMIRIIREEDPSRPSTRLSTNESLPSLAALRRTEPRKLMSMLKGELDWVVMKCLEKQRERRYETANGLAREIQRYLADEMVEARPPSTRYRLGKFVRKYPLQLALPGTLSLLILGGAGVIWWQQEQAGSRRERELRAQLEEEQRAAAEIARLARNAETVDSLLNQTAEALVAGDAKRAGLLLDAARKRSAEGGAEEAQGKLVKLQRDEALLAGLDGIDQSRWTLENGTMPSYGSIAGRIEEVFRNQGLDLVGDENESLKRKIQESVIRPRLVLALDFTLWSRRNSKIRDLLRQTDPDPFRDEVRDCFFTKNNRRLKELGLSAQADSQPATFASLLGLGGSLPVDRRRELLLKGIVAKPNDFHLLMSMGDTFSVREKKDLPHRMRWFQAAIAAMPESSAAYNNLGVSLKGPGQEENSEICLKKSMELQSNNYYAFYNSAVNLREKGEFEKALELLKKVVEISPTWAPGYEGLGHLYFHLGDHTAAMGSFQKALQFNPKSIAALDGLGVVFSKAGNLDKAIECFRAAIQFHPREVQAKVHLSGALRKKNQFEESRKILREGGTALRFVFGPHRAGGRRHSREELE